MLNDAEPVLRADLAIIGGGPAGAALALAASRQRFSVILVDARDPAASPAEDARNYALVTGSWRLMEAIGVAPALLEDAQPLNGLEATDGARHWFGAPSVLFTNEDLAGDAPLGQMVEASRLQAALDAALDQAAGVTRLSPALFDSLEQVAGAVRVSLKYGGRVEAPLLAGCDGVTSPVRRALGIRTESRSYGKSVFAANVALSRPHDGVARQLFTPEGPFALLPLKGDRANLAWYMKSGAAEALTRLTPEEIEAELNHRFETFAGPMRLISAPLAYPLRMQLAVGMTGPRVALVGDSAHRINPLAGQGLNLGLKDVAALVEVMCEARHAGLDIGAPTTLERYQRWRRFDSVATGLGMDAIDRAFSNDNLLLKPLRSAALTLADKVGPLRRALARQASAAQPALPKLLRGEAL